MKTSTTNELNRAYELIQRITPKLKDIEAAASFLAQKRKVYPRFLEELCALHPELNLFTLTLYAEIGDDNFYAPYVIYTGCGIIIQKIACLPLALQKKIYHEGVDLVVGGTVVRYKFFDITRKLVQLLFDGTHLRTVEEQIARLKRPVTPRPHFSKSRYSIDKEKGEVRIANVTLFKRDVIAIAHELLSTDDLIDLLQTHRENKKAAA
jgi:hypothetical protein